VQFTHLHLLLRKIDQTGLRSIFLSNEDQEPLGLSANTGLLNNKPLSVGNSRTPAHAVAANGMRVVDFLGLPLVVAAVGQHAA